MSLKIGKASLKGREHDQNEDAGVGQVTGQGGWVVLIDGMTGHGMGDVVATLGVFSGGNALFNAPSPADALIEAHEAVCVLENLGRDGRRPGGSGLTAVILGNSLQAARVGDVRGYIWTFLDAVKLLFGKDHHNGKGLTRWLGQPGELNPEAIEKELPEEYVLLFLTDGVWDPLGEGLLDQLVAQGGGAQSIADRIVEWAHQIDGYDDTTALVIVKKKEE